MRKIILCYFPCRMSALIDRSAPKLNCVMAARGSCLRSVDEIRTTLESESDNDSDMDGEFNYSSVSSEVDDSSDDETTIQQRKRPRQTAARPNLANAVWGSGDFVPTLFPFTVQNSGVNPAANLSLASSEMDIFKVFFTTALMQLIVMECNAFFIYLSTHSVLKENSRLNRWQDTTVPEMYVFFATIMLMALQKKLKIADYWSTDPLISSPMFAKIMSSDRFFLLLRMLHFSDNENQVPGDRLYKIRPVMESLKRSFLDMFLPYQNLVIDESLMPWKGRLSFKQYIPSKRHRFGIKLFVLCDCKTGYLMDFIVYTGSETEIIDTAILEDGMGKSGAIVLTLMQGFLNKGHILYTDNWYTSPTLSTHLHKSNTGTCGTVRPNRKEMPTFPKKVKKGESKELHNNIMLAVKWHDKRDVHMLTSVHETGNTKTGKKVHSTGEDILKPTCVVNYNQNMGAVDKTDMQLSFTECMRKSCKWYKNFFFHLLDLAVLNSFVIYKELHPKSKNLQFGEFRLNLIRQLLQEHHQPRKSSKGGRTSAALDPLRLTERHFPDFVPPTEKKTAPTRYCIVCCKSSLNIRKRKESRYMCKICNVALCVSPCFGVYHTKLVF